MKYPGIEDLYALYLKYPVVGTDTRNIKKDSIFFSLKGANFNANEFAKEAISKGAKYAVIDEEAHYSEGCILVKDVLATLQQLANHHRKQFKIPVIGITGSNGKTTTKELMATVLSKKYKTHFTQGNLNNHIGVPLTLLALKKEHEIAIIEMGANHQGEIAALSNIAEPDFGIITNIGKAHLEGFGGPEGVIKAKSELYHFIKAKKGKLFVNADDELLMRLSNGIDRVTYGTSPDSDCEGITEKESFLAKAIFIDDGIEVEVQSKLAGRYNFYNMLAAACVGFTFGLTLSQIKEAIEGYVPSNNRSQVVKKESNIIWVDAYNANPSSMKSAIETFAELPENNKVLILGDMFELGDESPKEHQSLADLIENKKCWNAVYLVGKEFGKTKSSATLFETTEAFAEWLKTHALKERTILLKGSRGMAMEKLLEKL
ncbi:MAG TPA: UDP-N-acetylmuramoyl-tripeptide--D-alanyl-D-alanine ligase [Bacteroidia bacterium]|jgi:UDP-N-acetylmuramoyl-tripeptide--D-alanyl-D-alanine ligase|nr:UDP-N-acetylmuramoyl-tripeptide--D-alanyl-D-alanine ligase [Bacteroidia bacterium]